MSAPNPPILTFEQISQALMPFGIAMSDEKLGSIQKYVDILIAWNQSISLTSLDDPLEIVSRHLGESIFAGTFLPLNSGRLADVGSGAGFPGLALKIAYPELSVVLIEANLKKCAFLNEVRDALQLDGVEIQRTRYEEYRPQSGFDFICSRALGDYRRFLGWAHDTLTARGQAVLWLGTEDSIIVGRTTGWAWDPPVKIPESRRRVIVCGRIISE